MTTAQVIFKYTLTPDLPLDDYLGDLSRAKIKKGLAYSKSLRQEPLFALQQLQDLTTAFIAATISEQGRGDLHAYLMVLCHQTYSENVDPACPRTLTSRNAVFWNACVEMEVPRMLTELLANEDALSLKHYMPMKYGAAPMFGYAILALLCITRIWDRMLCKEAPPFRVMKPMTESLLHGVMCTWVPMWTNMRKYRKNLFNPLFCQGSFAGYVMDIALGYFRIHYMLTGENTSVEQSIDMIHTLFWAWTNVLGRPTNRENAPVHITYAVLLPLREDDDPRSAVIVKSLLADVGQESLLLKMAAVIADSPTVYGGELENLIDVFEHFLVMAGRDAFDRVPILHVLQRAFSRYRLNVGRPGYGFGGDDDSDEYRKRHLLRAGFNLLSRALLGIYEGTRSVEASAASDMMDILLSLMLIARDATRRYSDLFSNSDVANEILNFFSQWARQLSHRQRGSRRGKKTRQLKFPRSFVHDMRRVAIDQERWYIVLRALRSAPVQPLSAPLRVRMIDAWEHFGQSLNLPSEESMKAALQMRRTHFCHDTQCLYNSGTAVAPDVMRRCRGCSEAYYCSKECQRRDWKDGGHKDVCGHRLAAS